MEPTAATGNATTAGQPAAAPPALGVLFVHGFGGQKRGNTLVRFGEPLVRWLNRWIDDETAFDPAACAVPLADTVLTRVRGSEPDAPPHTETRARRGLPGQPAPAGRWLLAESWWATDFSPASFSEVAKWGIGIGPWVFARYLRIHRSWVFVLNLQYFVALIAGPLLQLAMLLLLVLAIVPFLRGFVGSIMLKLADSFGDAYVLVSSPMRFNAMTSKVQDDLRWLARQGCTSIAVVAHSQGTAVAHRALAALPPDQPPVSGVKLFVTFGTAIDKLHRLLHVVPTGRRVVTSGLISTFGIMVGVLVPAFVIWRDWPGGDANWAVAVSAVVLGVAIFYAGVFLPTEGIFKISGVPTLQPADLWPHATAPTSPVSWHDYYARADPVPDGRLPLPGGGVTDDVAVCLDPAARLRSCEIRNRDAITHDHSIYSENAEQFMAPLTKALTEAAGWSIGLDAHWAHVQAAMRDRSTRVTHLTAAYVLAVLSALGATIWLGIARKLTDVARPIAEAITYLAERLPLPGEGLLAGSADEQPVRWLLAVLFVAAVAGVWYRLVVFLFWRNWEQRAIDALFARGARPVKPRDRVRFTLAALLTPFVVLLVLLFWLVVVVDL